MYPLLFSAHADLLRKFSHCAVDGLCVCCIIHVLGDDERLNGSDSGDARTICGKLGCFPAFYQVEGLSHHNAQIWSEQVNFMLQNFDSP